MAITAPRGATLGSHFSFICDSETGTNIHSIQQQAFRQNGWTCSSPATDRAKLHAGHRRESMQQSVPRKGMRLR
jgi:hypothetical protein